jgi:hypothetical protein
VGRERSVDRVRKKERKKEKRKRKKRRREKQEEPYIRKRSWNAHTNTHSPRSGR